MLIAVVILCCALTGLNLVLTLGVIRRLRTHSNQLEDLAHKTPRSEPMTGPGTRPGAFTASPLNAAPVTNADLGNGSIVAFFSTTCDSCEEWLPKFIDALAAMPGDLTQRLAIVVSDTPATATAMIDKLKTVAMVAVEQEKGPIAKAFKVSGYPAMCRLDAGGMVVTYRPADVLALPVAA
jgi:hypothetical protein